MTSDTPTSLSTTKRRIALRDALSMLRVEWTREHLLGAMPATDAAILSSPLQQLHMCSFESDMSFDAIDHDGSNNNRGTMVGSEAVMVPAYTKDGINVGYCLSETAGLTSQGFIDFHSGTAVQNFIVREHDGLYVGVTRHPDVELLMSVSCERRTKRFYCFAFPGRVFSNLVNQGCGDVSTFERALCAIVRFQCVKECLICGASSHISCHCNASLSTSKAPLDLPAIRNNIVHLHRAHAQGSGMFEMFSNGVPKSTTRLSVNVNADSCVKQGRAKRFVNWAVADALKDTPLEVSRGVTSPIGVEHDNAEIRNSLQSNTTHAQDLSQQDLLTTQTTNESSKEVSVLQETLDISDSPPLSAISAPEDPSEAPVPKHNIDFDPQVNTASAFPEDLLAISTETPLPTQASNCRLILLRSTAVVEPAFPLATNLPSTSRHAATPVPSRAVPIASRGTVDILPHPSRLPVPDEVRMKKMAEELRQWRAYHRKIRNRESAMRSNLRKQRKKHATRNQHQALPGDKQA